MTDEMLDLARANAAQAGATNVEFLKGTIEDIPLPDASVDVVISNCVINLSVDKPKVITEMFRVLSPGGRIGISDVVAEDHLTATERAERGSYVGCIAGALSRPGIPRRPHRRRLHQRDRPFHPPGRGWHAQRDHPSHQAGVVSMIDNKLVRAGQPHPAADHRRAAATRLWSPDAVLARSHGSPLPNRVYRVKGRLCRPAGAVSSLRCGPAAASRRGRSTSHRSA